MRGAVVIRSLIALAALTSSAAAALPDDAAVRALLVDRLAQNRGVGFAVVLIDANGSRIITAGVMREGGPAVAANTVFEIGSVTKTFTGLLLADAIVRGDVKADDPVEKALPTAAPGLTLDGRKVTFAQLASHTSGLPRLPANWQPANAADPYADYDGSFLLASLGVDVLVRPPGTKFEYSNLGAGLLGYALGVRAGGYESALRERILTPLGMADTGLKLSQAQEMRFATGHDPHRMPVPPWHLDALAGAGGLRSTAFDMAKYLKAAVDPAGSPLGAAVKLAQTPIAEGPVPSLRIAMGWHVTQRGATTHLWHNGRTGGHASMIVVDPARREGVAVLSNASISVDDLAVHILDATVALIPVPRQRTVSSVDLAVFDRLAGRYELASNFALTIYREGDRFFAQATRQDKVEIFPESEYEYFSRTVDAQISFVRDGGKVTGIVLHQGGRDVPGKRVD